MLRCLPILLCCLPACMPPADPPAARGVLPPPRRPAEPVERRPASRADTARTPQRVPEVADPFAAPGPIHRLEAPELPGAWPVDAFDLVAHYHARRVVAAEDIVGLSLQGDLLAISAGGGVFRDDGFGRLRAERTQLPAVTRTFTTPEVLVACVPPLDSARFSIDRGVHWGSLGFQCGQAGARTIAGRGDRTYALAGELLRIGPLPAGAVRTRPLPVADAEALGALGDRVLIVGAEALALSTDGGEHFVHLPRPPGLAAVRDVAFVGKGTLLLAGVATPEGSPLMRSVDAGRHWLPVAVPRRVDHVAALAVHPDGSVLAVPDDAAADALLSRDAGARFEPLPPGTLARGAAAVYGDGFVTGAARGVITGVEARVPTLGLRAPLHAVVFSHPRVAVGIGRDSGLFRTLDGGRTWQAHPAGRGARFGDLTRITDHAVMLVGDGILWRSEDAGLRWDQRPLPSSCAARWVRFDADGRRGTVGCADGSLLETTDGGFTWFVGETPPAPLQPVVWIDGKRWALDAEGQLYNDADGVFVAVPAPLPAPAHVARIDGQLSLLDRGGQAARLRPAGWQATAWVDPPADTRSHHPLSDGGALVVTDRQVLHVTPDAPPHALATDALDAIVTGDGGVLLLGAHDTTLLEAR